MHRKSSTLPFNLLLLFELLHLTSALLCFVSTAACRLWNRSYLTPALTIRDPYHRVNVTFANRATGARWTEQGLVGQTLLELAQNKCIGMRGLKRTH
jgi:hypothetical protein